jgi:hypothetical protein
MCVPQPVQGRFAVLSNRILSLAACFHRRTADLREEMTISFRSLPPAPL